MIPGEYLLAESPVEANPDRPMREIEVANTGDRPIQVGSHFHFFEANKALLFDRSLAFGMRLNVPAGTAVRFEPGDSKRVPLVAIGGGAAVFGLNGLTNGATGAAQREGALGRARSREFLGADS
jgi:urease beta subunit